MPQQIRSRLAIAGAAAVLLGAGLSGAYAQQQPPAQQQAPAQQQPAMPQLTESQIDTFADAALGVRQVQEDLSAQMQTTQDANEILQLQEQAQQEAQQAIEDSGLTVDQYNAIVQAANQDPQLYAMIVDAMEEKAQ